MPVHILFESHGTTFDNENNKASGWFDVDLSPLGESQAKELGDRLEYEAIDAIFCSDQMRSYHTAWIAFEGKKIPLFIDWRLRECDYGELNQADESMVKPLKPNHVHDPFPGGESYDQTNERMKSFLKDLLERFDGKRVLIIGHRATQYGLESLILGKPLEEVVPAKWSWQPGWEYELTEI